MPQKTKEITVKKPIGRPSLYSEAIVNEVFERLMLGETLIKILKDSHLPSEVTFYKWLNNDDDLMKSYARAREIQCQRWEDEMIELADQCGEDNEFSRPSTKVKNQIDLRKWLMSKRKPSQYGDKLDLTTKGDKLTNITAIQVIIEYPNGNGSEPEQISI